MLNLIGLFEVIKLVHLCVDKLVLLSNHCQTMKFSLKFLRLLVALNPILWFKMVKSCIAVNETPSHSYGVSLAIWDRTVSPPRDTSEHTLP